MIAVDLHRNPRSHLLKHNGDTIDFDRVNDHVRRIHSKYQRRAASTGLEKVSSIDIAQQPLGWVTRWANAISITPAKDADPSSGSVPLTDTQQESLWVGKMRIGSSDLMIDFDTGSSDVILNHTPYKPGKSAKDTGETFSIGYGDGTKAVGRIYTDTINIGGLKAKNVALGWATDNAFVDFDYDGLAGMGFQVSAQTRRPPFFDVLMASKKLKENVFTFTLQKEGSSLHLGGIPKCVQGQPVYVDVDSSKGFWTTAGTLNGMKINAIHDTGTTLIIAPKKFAKDLFNKLNVKTLEESGTLYGLYGTHEFPVVDFCFGDFTKQMSSQTVFFAKTNDGQNVMSIIGADLGLDELIIGDSWLRNVVAVFSRKDRNKPQIGFISNDASENNKLQFKSKKWW